MYLEHPYTLFYIYLYIDIYVCNYVHINDLWSLCVNVGAAPQKQSPDPHVLI